MGLNLDAMLIPGLQYTPGSFQAGAGSPEGVIAAPVGTVYEDTAATLGAVLWVKASGVGNTGWRVVSGDTGWRTPAFTDSTDWEPSAVVPLYAIRRVNSVVSFNFRVQIAATSTYIGLARSAAKANLYALPGGFRVPTNNYNAFGAVIYGSNVATGLLTTLPSANRLDVLVSTAAGLTAAGDAYAGTATWLTDDAWPSVLP